MRRWALPAALIDEPPGSRLPPLLQEGIGATVRGIDRPANGNIPACFTVRAYPTTTTVDYFYVAAFEE
jgi:hypothetical protein